MTVAHRVAVTKKMTVAPGEGLLQSVSSWQSVVVMERAAAPIPRIVSHDVMMPDMQSPRPVVMTVLQRHFTHADDTAWIVDYNLLTIAG